MNQDAIAQQDALAGGNGGFNTTTGYATGTVVPFSGTFRASNKYMDIVQLYAAGEIFFAGADNRKTTWYALTPTLSTNQDGGFASVKVAAGTV
ncbi:MAG TPA: hypothetical protein VGJ37_09780 [Pyrinomonadaceae bacterium]|jgi:hypothetical protein